MAYCLRMQLCESILKRGHHNVHVFGESNSVKHQIYYNISLIAVPSCYTVTNKNIEGGRVSIR